MRDTFVAVCRCRSTFFLPALSSTGEKRERREKGRRRGNKKRQLSASRGSPKSARKREKLRHCELISPAKIEERREVTVGASGRSKSRYIAALKKHIANTSLTQPHFCIGADALQVSAQPMESSRRLPT